MKSREVFELLRNEVSPNMMRVLQAITDRQSHQAQEIVEIAKLIDKVATLVNNMTVVGEQMKSALVLIQSQRGVGIESVPVDNEH